MVTLRPPLSQRMFSLVALLLVATNAQQCVGPVEEQRGLCLSGSGMEFQVSHNDDSLENAVP